MAMNRRHLLGVVGSGLFSGCVGNFDQKQSPTYSPIDCTGSSTKSWNSFQADSGNTGFTQNTIRSKPSKSVVYDGQTTTTLSPVSTGSELCIPDSGDIHITDLSGSLLWTYEADANVRVPLLASCDRLVVFSDERLGSLSLSSGELTWTIDGTSGLGEPSPVVVGDSIVAVHNGYVKSFTLRSGNLEWKKSVTDYHVYGLGATPDTVYGTYTSDSTGSLFALDSETGKKQWEHRIGPTRAPPTCRKNTILVTTKDGRLSRFDPSGTEQWSRSHGVSGTYPPVFTGQQVFVIRDSELLAVDPESGSIQWGQTVGSDPVPPVATPDSVYVGSNDGIDSYASTDGTRRWRLGDIQTLSPLAITGNDLLVNSGRRILAIR